MSIDPRWAARVQLVRELWEGRDRVVIDPAVERALEGTRRPSGPMADVAQALLSRGGARARLLADDPRALPGARRYTGLEVADATATAAILDSSAWEVALVDLGRYLGADATPSRMLRRDLPGLARRLDRRAITILDVLADGAAHGRVVVISVAAERVKVAEFQALIEACFERAHLFGLAPLPVMAAVDFGIIDRADDGRGAGDPEVGIAFDNSLGSDPRFSDYVAIIGRTLAGGLTLLEVPPSGGAATREGTDTLRIQIAQARRQLELATAARESLVEQLDAAQTRAGGLEERCAQLEGRLADAAWGPGPGEATKESASSEAEAAGAQALQATVQSLRWELDKAKEEVTRLAERPVSALEAEVASLRARLDGTSGDAAAPSRASAPPGGEGIERARAAVDILLRRLDRGGIGQREIRRKLAEVAELLGGSSVE
ncbi:MAG: hypothetical protein R3A79_27350 [Nannocystaceae bacterium]